MLRFSFCSNTEKKSRKRRWEKRWVFCRQKKESGWTKKVWRDAVRRKEPPVHTVRIKKDKKQEARENVQPLKDQWKESKDPEEPSDQRHRETSIWSEDRLQRIFPPPPWGSWCSSQCRSPSCCCTRCRWAPWRRAGWNDGFGPACSRCSGTNWTAASARPRCPSPSAGAWPTCRCRPWPFMCRSHAAPPEVSRSEVTRQGSIGRDSWNVHSSFFSKNYLDDKYI